MLMRTRAIANIEILDGTRVESLKLDAADRVIGVVYSDAPGAKVELDCDIVVDASGASGAFVNKLAVKYPDMKLADTIASNIVYASATLKKPAAWADSKENVLLIPEPTHGAGGALLDIEQDHWVVSLHGRNGIMPPTEPGAWKLFAKERLPVDAIWERIDQAELIGDIVSFRKPLSVWRRFDQAAKLPPGYFPLGDTISSVNPIFGQGMTVAFGHALSLREAFSAGSLEGAQEQYVHGAASWSERAWRRVSAYDATFAQTDEKQNRHHAIMRSLALARQRKAHEDPKVHEQLVRQAQMQI